MDLNQLKSFLEIVREGSFTKAAKKLFLTQPALSLQIKAVEEELGVQLFERGGRQIHLTDAGQTLLSRAEEILGLVEQTRQEVVSLKELRSGRLTLGSTEANCLYVLPAIVKSFREKFPEVDIRLTSRKSAELVNLVAEGAIDFGIATLPVSHPRIETSPLFWRQDVAVCRRGHPLTEKHRVTPEDLVEYPLLLLEVGSTSRKLIDGMFAEMDLVPKNVMELGSVEAIKQFVAIDLGVSIVPELALEREVKDGQLHAMRLSWLPARHVGVIQRKNAYVSPASRMFLKLLKNYLPDMLFAPL